MKDRLIVGKTKPPKHGSSKYNPVKFVPVVDMNQQPLMPTTPARAAKWIKAGKATPFFKKGIFCVRLNVEPSARETQEIWIGVDPGSKKEGYTVKSEAHTYLNLNVDAKTDVKDKIEVRRNMRRGRRNRKTPCRAPRGNRSCLRGNRIPPSTKARWDWKLRIIKVICGMFPISGVIVEDIKARTRKGKGGKWNLSFSPLEVGKVYFYDAIRKMCLELETNEGHQTFEMRSQQGLKKSKAKMAPRFDTHCVDSWVMVNGMVGGHLIPDNESILCVSPVNYYRRQLHVLQPAKGNIRKRMGGSMCHGFKKGSVVRHPKHGIAYVGGWLKDRIALCSMQNGKRICQNAKPLECKFLSWSTWKTSWVL